LFLCELLRVKDCHFDLRFKESQSSIQSINQSVSICCLSTNTMRFSVSVLLSLLVVLARTTTVDAVSSAGLFKKDVVQAATRKARMQRQMMETNNELLSKAISLDEYERKLNEHGMTLGADFVKEHHNNNQLQRRLDQNFEVDYEDMYSFSGYSLRYAKCQPVQYFSENAVLAGEHSPMVTQDIVVLRLCPQATCSDSSTYGCYYNYADYALTLNEYVKIMLKYTAKLRDYTCEWCEECANGNNGNNNNNGNNQNNNNNGEENNNNGRQRRRLEDGGQQEDNGEEQQEQQQQEDNYDNAYACDGYDTYCYTYSCDNAEQQDDDGNNYMDYEEYLDYIDCAEVQYNDYAYFVRPRCDGQYNTFKMEVYYDNYCIQYAGSDLTVKSLGLGFKEGMFENYYSKTCIDCSETVSPKTGQQ